MLPFGERVRRAIASTGPLCVGIDPSASSLDAWGLADDAAGLRAFGVGCVEAVSGVVPVVKPQVAFFERHGAAGMAAFEEVVAVAREAGLIVLADAKRGDIGSTTEAYADAWFRGPFAGDALTATPYVGIDALWPMVSAARTTGRGLVVVVSSSNPEGRALQDAVTADGRSVQRSLLDAIALWNREELANAAGMADAADAANAANAANAADAADISNLGTVGAVVGAVHGAVPVEGLEDLGGIVLAPGLGAQGAGVDDVARRFAGCPPGSVLPAVSRGVQVDGERGMRDAAQRLVESLAGALR